MIDVAALERAARLALPAIREVPTPGWVVRVSGGTTKRINSANPITPMASLAPVQERAERLYAEHDLPARFRLTPLAADRVDAELEEAGYALADPSLTMVAPLLEDAVDPAARIASRASAAWLAALATASGWASSQRDVHAAVLARTGGDVAFASIDEAGEPMAWGIGSIADGICCLFDIIVAAERRGQGVGRRLVGSILGCAHRQGAHRALLQVQADNVQARALYRSLGFTDAYRYHYRIRSAGA